MRIVVLLKASREDWKPGQSSNLPKCNYKVGYLYDWCYICNEFKQREMVAATRDDVKSFLEQFHAKMKVFGIIYRDDRGKNQKTLEELEIVPSFRKIIIENLKVEDYVEGPLIDTLNHLGEMWVFGKDIKNREVYIKIMISNVGGQTICISFHLAESKMTYPFKEIL